MSLLAVGCGGTHSTSAGDTTTSTSVSASSGSTKRSPTSAATVTTVARAHRPKSLARRRSVPTTVSLGGASSSGNPAAGSPTPAVGGESTGTPSASPGGAPVTPTSTVQVTTTTVKPFDPSEPIDLSGTPGVSPEQQAAAEQLLRDTLRDLPAFANPTVAFNAGYRSIGDGFTGDEHFINLAYMNDNDVLDSKRPESLVYNTRTGSRILEAAMYMLPPGSRFTDIPPLFQSPLTQWHVHADLCFYVNPADPKQLLIGGRVDANGNCPPGQYLAGNVPMLHAWIVKNPCGPFAALEGIAAGQVAPGETRNCDTGHAGVL